MRSLLIVLVFLLEALIVAPIGQAQCRSISNRRPCAHHSIPSTCVNSRCPCCATSAQLGSQTGNESSSLKAIGPNPSCYSDCFARCRNGCVPPWNLACLGRCSDNCRNVCAISCGPCTIDATGNSTQVCWQSGKGWRQSCCIPGSCKPDVHGVCNTGYCRECCTYINHGSHVVVLCGLSSCVP